MIVRCLTALATVFAATAASAQTPLIACGDLDGYSYFAAQSPLGPKGGGWVKDAISPGRNVLVVDKEGKLDILGHGAAGYFSYRGDKCDVVQASKTGDGPPLVVAAICAYSIDIFQFFMKPDGTGQLLFSQAKFAPLIAKATTMTANCRRE